MEYPTGIKVVIVIGVFTFLAVTIYWTAWFLAPEVVEVRHPGETEYDVYVAFQQAFPLPDAFAALAALVGAIGLLKMRDWGLLSMLLAAGGFIFLGLEDLLFDLQHNMFNPFGAEAATELSLVLANLGLGTLTAVLLWNHRRELIR